MKKIVNKVNIVLAAVMSFGLALCSWADHNPNDCITFSSTA